MKRIFTTLALWIPITLFGQNPHDSLTIIYKSDKLIEIVKPLLPEIDKRTEPSKYNGILNGIYIDREKYGVVKNGEIKIYDRFYQLIERIEYRDSVFILDESFKNGKLTDQLRFIPVDSIYIFTDYYQSGKPKSQNRSSCRSETDTRWFDNGQIESICEKKANSEKCDYWSESGLYIRGTIRKYNGLQVTSEIEIDKNGNEVKRIK